MAKLPQYIVPPSLPASPPPPLPGFAVCSGEASAAVATAAFIMVDVDIDAEVERLFNEAEQECGHQPGPATATAVDQAPQEPRVPKQPQDLVPAPLHVGTVQPKENDDASSDALDSLSKEIAELNSYLPETPSAAVDAPKVEGKASAACCAAKPR
jgi:hypothetical protein